MVYLVGLLLIVLLGIAVAVAAKLQNVMGNIKSASDTEAPAPNNKINGALWILFLIAGTIGMVWSYLSAKEYFLPEASSPHGRETDSQFWFDMGIADYSFFCSKFFTFLFLLEISVQKRLQGNFLS